MYKCIKFQNMFDVLTIPNKHRSIQIFFVSIYVCFAFEIKLRELISQTQDFYYLEASNYTKLGVMRLIFQYHLGEAINVTNISRKTQTEESLRGFCAFIKRHFHTLSTKSSTQMRKGLLSFNGTCLCPDKGIKEKMV